jgi:hypothetical protein
MSESTVAVMVGVSNAVCFRPNDKLLMVVTMHTKSERINETRGVVSLSGGSWALVPPGRVTTQRLAERMLFSPGGCGAAG